MRIRVSLVVLLLILSVSLVISSQQTGKANPIVFTEAGMGRASEIFCKKL